MMAAESSSKLRGPFATSIVLPLAPMLPLYCPSLSNAIDDSLDQPTSRGLIDPTASTDTADRLLRALAALGGLLIWLMLAAVLITLLIGAWPSIHAFGIHFLLRPGSPGLPHKPGQSFGAAQAITATIATSCMALLLALPPSLATAIFLVRLASTPSGRAAWLLIKAMAAIPSVAYGYWGAAVLVPWLQHWTSTLWGPHPMPTASGSSLNSTVAKFSPAQAIVAAAIVLALMIAPLLAAISGQLLDQCRADIAEGAVALGATWWQSACVMLSRCRRGLVGAALLSLGRSVGETIVVAMVFSAFWSPATSATSGSPAESTPPIASLLAMRFAEAPLGIERASMIELALILMAMSLLLVLAGRHLGVTGQTSDIARG
jgi:phosphate transport system permease protein